MVDSSQRIQSEQLKPPVTRVGAIGWVRANLFSSVFNSLLTIVTLYLLWKIVPGLIRWTFIDSSWATTGAECRVGGGACWSIVTKNLRFILFGFFPYEWQWRPLLAMGILIGLLFYSRNRKHWKKSLLYAWLVGLLGMGILMKGGLFGLASIDTLNRRREKSNWRMAAHSSWMRLATCHWHCKQKCCGFFRNASSNELVVAKKSRSMCALSAQRIRIPAR